MSQEPTVTAVHDEQPRKVKTNLLGLSASRIGDFLESLGEKRFRGTQILKWIHQYGIDDLSEMTNISKGLRESLAEVAEVVMPNCTPGLGRIDNGESSSNHFTMVAPVPTQRPMPKACPRSSS